MNSNLSALEQIIQSIDVTPQRQVLLYGKSFGEEFSNPFVQQPSNKMLFQNLQDVIYTVFYSKNKAWPPITATTANAPLFQDIEAFMNELSLENTSYETFDNGWLIEHIDAQGMITARKGNHTRPVHHGEFLNASGFHHPPTVSQGIRIVCRKEHKDATAGFYYMFGNTVTEDNPDQLVRIYFNIKPAGIKQLIHSLSDQLNTYKVPFNFKCVNHPFFFTRCDASVLYFDKRYCNIVFALLKKICLLIKPHLLPETPLFTKELAKGVAFAENPYRQDESFGTHISKMLAQGIMNALNKNVLKQQWLQEVRLNIEQQHHYKDLERLYLNADSVYPYQFPDL
jgi:hypothetical protein